MSFSRWFYFQHALVSSSWQMSALRYLAHPTLLSRTFCMQGLCSLSFLLFLSVLCFALSCSPVATAAELGDRGGQDLFNFSFNVKTLLLHSVHPFLRTSSQTAAWPCALVLLVARVSPHPAQHNRKIPQKCSAE